MPWAACGRCAAAPETPADDNCGTHAGELQLIRGMMLRILQIAATMAVVVVMALSLAHALELPGKRRLSRDQYLTVQAIYYPGFTLGGIAEPLAIVLLAALMYLTWAQALPFYLESGAVAAVLAVQLIYILD